MFPAIKAVVQLLCKILQLASPEIGNKYPNEDGQQKDPCKQNKAKQGNNKEWSKLGEREN